MKETEAIPLDELKPEESARVLSISGENDMKQRLEDLGVVRGTKIVCVMKSPLGDPVAYLIRGAVIALRKEDSHMIAVSKSPWNERYK